MNGSLPAIEIDRLVKRYGDFTAVDGISLHVADGEFFGLLGPNGAGKTTTINSIVGLSTITSGTIRLFGHDVERNWRAARRLVGLAPQEYNFDRYLSIRDILIFQAGYYGFRGKAIERRADDLLERFELSSKAKQLYTRLSGGMKRRLTIARALIHQPRILILDEPTAGVDVELRLELWEFLRRLNADGITIVLTTHYLEEAEELCKRIGIIEAGKIVALESTRALVGDRTLQDVFLELTPPLMVNLVGFETIVRREMKRTFAIINQVIWPPVIQTLLYVFVFGLALGSRIQQVQGVSYAQFILPGLIMLQVIEQTYGEGSSTVFQGRFMNSIQEILIAPISAVELVVSYIVAGVVRAVLIAALITALGIVFVHTAPIDWPLYFFTIVMVAVLFAALGIIMGLLAEKFDHIAVLTTFFITPLVFVGGVFTSTKFLPPAAREISLFNPMFHMIDAFRYSYTGTGDAPLGLSLAVVCGLTAVFVAVALRMVALGFKLRT